MEISAMLWDKISSINGRDALFLSEHFKKQNGNDDRILIVYDGVVSEIHYVDDSLFTTSEREHVNSLIEGGLDYEQAIAETWAKKAQQAHEKARLETLSIEQIRADTDYIAFMTGVDLYV